MDSSDCGSVSRDNLQPAEVTQSPEKIYFEPEGIVILKQPERTFVLTNNELNLLIINSDETIVREYVHAPYYKPKLGELTELYGECLNGARAVSVSLDNIEKPQVCQVKINGATKTYTFNKINRIEV